MAVYTTKALVRTLDKLMTIALVSDVDLDQCITDATDLVDAGLVGRYVTPFADIAASPATPKKIALIARYFAAGLALQRYYSDRSNIDDETEEPRSKSYLRQARYWLKEVQGDKDNLPDSGVTLQTDVAKNYAGRIFTTTEKDAVTTSGFPSGSLRDEVTYW